MGYISRIKTWIAGEVLTHSDLNAEFDNCISKQIPEPSSIAQGDLLQRGATQWERLYGVQGDILYRGATSWEKLSAGVLGKYLKTLGAGANPLWDVVPSIRDKVRNLVIKNNGTHFEHQLDISVDEVLLQDSNYLFYVARAVSLTVDIDVSGVNGLDTGSKAGGQDYFIWVIYNPTTDTVKGLLSLSVSAPTMPSGYTFKALLGAISTDAISNFIYYYQLDNKVGVQSFQVLNAGNATTYTDINLSAFYIPVSIVKRVSGFAAATSGHILYLSGAPTRVGDLQLTGAGGYKPFDLLFVTPNIAYAVSAGGAGYIHISGWEY